MTPTFPERFRIDAGAVVVREPRTSDAERWLAALQDPLVQHHSGLHAASLESVLEDLGTRYPATRAAGDGCAAAVADAESDELLGMVGAWNFVRSERRAELGFWLLPQARGRGILRAAVPVYVEWVIALSGVERITAYSDVDNPRAHAVLEAAGFAREGQLARYGMRSDGSRIDAYVFGLVPSAARS